MNDNCILIVDDDPLIRRTLERFLLNENFRVLLASSEAEALSRIREESPDIILLDVRLGKTNGLSFLKNHLLPESGPHRVIVLTGFHSSEDADEAVMAGAYDYLTKPLHLGKLKISIQNCLKLQAMARQLDKLTATKQDPVSLRNFVGTSQKTIDLVEHIKRIAPFNIPVLILGESGTGKELVARLLHSLSPRREGPFTPIDCGAIPDTLLESELFGYEPGAFSGATHTRQGKFEQANTGTMLLDEIANLPMLLQPKLLRAVQSMQVDRLGGTQSISVDVRIVAATNLNIHDMIKTERFREDLYHRLNGVTVKIPPLRERTEDIRLLASYALLHANRAYQTTIRGISSEAIAAMERYAWPGNVRELEHCIQSAAIQAETIISLAHLPEPIHQQGPARSESTPESASEQAAFNGNDAPPSGKSLFQIGRTAAMNAERAAILNMLHATNGNKAEAARRLQMDYKALHKKIRQYKISFSRSIHSWIFTPLAGAFHNLDLLSTLSDAAFLMALPG